METPDLIKDELIIEAEKLERRAEEIRHQRLEIAGRLKELRNQGNDRLKRRKELEKEGKLLEKRQIVEELLKKTQDLQVLKQKAAETEREQLMALVKVEEVDAELAKRSQLLKGSQLEKLPMKHFSDVVDIINKIKPAAEENTREAIQKAAAEAHDLKVHKNDTLESELRKVLEEAHLESQQRLLEERNAIVMEQVELEDRLEALKIQKNEQILTSSADVDIKNLSFDEVYSLALNSKPLAETRLLDFKKRLDQMQAEQEWIQKNPDTEFWSNLNERVAHMRYAERQMAENKVQVEYEITQLL